MDFIISSVTDIGIKRTENQDSIFASCYSHNNERAAFAVLCDGMGGLSHGSVASKSIVDAFSKWADEQLPNMNFASLTDQQIRMSWMGVIREENEKLRLFGVEHGCVVGSTLTAALLTERRYYIVNIGDSRAYLLGRESRQITEDHTMVAEEVRRGNLSETQAEQAPIKNILTRCVGVFAQAKPDFFFGETGGKCSFILCSDGFRHKISKEEMREYLVVQKEDEQSDRSEKLRRLVELNKMRGETDNISAIVIDIRS